MHFWAPGVHAGKVGAWIEARTCGRWPGERQPVTYVAVPGEGSVEGVALPPLPAAVTLASVPGDGELANSTRFWMLANRFLLRLLARGHFFPTHGNGTAPMWMADVRSCRRELEALCLAAPADALRGGHRASAISDWFGSVTDAVVRDAGRRLGWSTLVGSSRRSVQPAAVEDVLRALFADRPARMRARDPRSERLAREALRFEDPKPADAKPLRLLLVLETRPGGEPGWRIRFGALSGAEPVLLPEAWTSVDPAANLRRFGVLSPAVFLLRELGRAARTCPVLERGLGTVTPESVPLDPAEAYTFLHRDREALETAGFAVRVSPALAGPPRKPRLVMTVRPSSGSRDRIRGMSLNSLMSCDWQVAIGDERMSLREFQRLMRGKRRLIRLRDEWVDIETRAVDEMLLEASRRRHRTGREPDLRDAIRARLAMSGVGPGLFDEGPVLSRVEGEGWVDRLFTALETSVGQLDQLDPPQGLGTELRPYQRVGYRWLRLLADFGLGSCLADDMGLGKTCQALTFLLGEQEAGRLDRPYLLVCPTSLIANWRKEAQRFAPSLRLHAHQGPARLRGDAFGEAISRSDLVLCSFGITYRDLDFLKPVRWGGIVVDEAHNLKNPAAKQTRAMRRLEAPVRIALTGTPIENRLTDLWSIMEFLNPGLLGPERSFRRAFTAAVEGARDPETTATLRRLVRPFILRRLKTDPTVIRDLPERHQARVYCNLTPEQAALYQAEMEDSLARIEKQTGFMRRGEVLRTLTRLKQICNHPENFLRRGGALGGRSGKLVRLVEILDEVRHRGERALVFTQFAEMAKLLASHLEELRSSRVPVLHGGVPTAERDAIVTGFQEAPDAPDLLVVSLRTGGYGLNLTRANHVIHYDRWWNPGVENQATDRAFRIGQRQPVLVHKFLCVGTLEERIADMLERKSALADSVIEGGESWLASLSTEAFRGLMALGDEAVGG